MASAGRVLDVSLWETISSLVAAPSFGFLDLFLGSFWGFVGSGCGSGCVPVCSCLISGFAALVVSLGLVVLVTFGAVFSWCPHFCGALYPPLAVRRLYVFCFLFSGKQVSQAYVSSNVGFRWSDYTSPSLSGPGSQSFAPVAASASPLQAPLPILMCPVFLLAVVPLLVPLASALTPGLVLLPVARLPCPHCSCPQQFSSSSTCSPRSVFLSPVSCLPSSLLPGVIVPILLPLMARLRSAPCVLTWMPTSPGSSLVIFLLTGFVG